MPMVPVSVMPAPVMPAAMVMPANLFGLQAPDLIGGGHGRMSILAGHRLCARVQRMRCERGGPRTRCKSRDTCGNTESYSQEFPTFHVSFHLAGVRRSAGQFLWRRAERWLNRAFRFMNSARCRDRETSQRHHAASASSAGLRTCPTCPLDRDRQLAVHRMIRVDRQAIGHAADHAGPAPRAPIATNEDSWSLDSSMLRRFRDWRKRTSMGSRRQCNEKSLGSPP